MSALSAADSDKVSRLHARLSQPSHAAAHIAAVSAALQTAAAKPSSPDDAAIVAALKATLDTQEKNAEKEVVFLPHPSPPFSSTSLSVTIHPSHRRNSDASKRAPRFSRSSTLTTSPPHRPPLLLRLRVLQLQRHRASRTLKRHFASQWSCSSVVMPRPPLPTSTFNFDSHYSGSST